MRIWVPLIVLCHCVAAGCGHDAPLGNDQAAILGAAHVAPGTFLAVGALAVRDARVIEPTPCGFTLCTGTLIAPQMVLTAAHCVTGIPPEALSFCIGDTLDETLVALSAKRFHLHPSFVDEKPPGRVAAYQDIALVELSATTDLVRPLPLVSPEDAAVFLVEGMLVHGVGYGQGVVGQPETSGVKRTAVSTLRDVGPFEFWVQPTETSQKCHGDSGGPTLLDLHASPPHDWRVVGVASRTSAECTWGTIETRVDAYLPWLHEMADLPCGSGLSAPCVAAEDEDSILTATRRDPPGLSPPVITDRGCTLAAPGYPGLLILFGFAAFLRRAFAATFNRRCRRPGGPRRSS